MFGDELEHLGDEIVEKVEELLHIEPAVEEPEAEPADVVPADSTVHVIEQRSFGRESENVPPVSTIIKGA